MGGTYHHLLPRPLPLGILAEEGGTMDPTMMTKAKPMITIKTETVGFTPIFKDRV